MPTLSTTARDDHTPRSSGAPLAILPARVTWKDTRGALAICQCRHAMSAKTGSYRVTEATTIPFYRLVTFQLERDARNIDGLPQALRAGKVLSAVYRAGDFQKSTGTPEGYGLRLLVDPVTRANAAAPDQVEATA